MRSGLHPRLTVLALTALAALVLARPPAGNYAHAGGTHYKIIVHPDNPVTSVDREFLRGAYLKKTHEWSHGETVRPIDLTKRFPVRDQFTEEVLKKTSAQLKSYWSQQIFSGKQTPPPEASTPAEVIAYVLTHPGAVGYLPADVDPGRAKVVGVQ